MKTIFVGGGRGCEAVLDMMKRLRSDPMPPGTRAQWAGEGEWELTLRVFRDMGIAFAAALAADDLRDMAQLRVIAPDGTADHGVGVATAQEEAGDDRGAVGDDAPGVARRDAAALDEAVDVEYTFYGIGTLGLLHEIVR